jgi:tetratricopeptide (TPR) repeat protein
MSTTLNLTDRLLAMGRHLHELGRNQDALHFLNRLTGFRMLPAALAEEAQVHLAEIYLSRRKYRRARRHLTAALVHQPDSARYHYLMATALAGDDKADRQRAADHYRKSLHLDPDQAHCLSEFGLLALRLGQTEEGLRCLRRAVELAPNNPNFVRKLAEGLREEGQVQEARRVLRAALFRNGRDHRFRQLWNDFQFQQLHQEQQRQRRNASATAGGGGPVLLPFVRLAAETVPGRPRRKIIRHDPPSPPSPPHAPRPEGLPNQRHAQ